MTTIEILDTLTDEYELTVSEHADLLNSYDGLTPAERELSPDLVEATRRAPEHDPKSLAAAMFQVSREVELYFYFDFMHPQIGSGD